MGRDPGSIKVGGVSFDRPGRQEGLLGVNPRHIEESNRGYVAVPGGGFLAWAATSRGRDRARQPRRVSGGHYDGLSPFDSHPNAAVPSDFNISAAGTAGVMTPMPDARERSYGWHIDSIIEDVVTGEFIDSTAPESVESDDDQSGLDDFHGHLTACADSQVTQCDCCRCPECGIKSINARVNKEPTYRCYGDGCGAEFEDPMLRPGQRK